MLGITDKNSIGPREPIRLLFRLENISKGYPDGRKGWIDVFKGLNLCIVKGVITGIVGVSGCGKSTLLHIMGAIDNPDEGEVYFDGDILDYDDERQMEIFRMKHIAFIFQDLNLTSHFNVLKNVMLPLFVRGEFKTHARVMAANSLAAVGLLGEGTNNKSRSRVYNLSGGERQRVAIARALASNVKAILADEPTGNLDSFNTERIMELLKKINRENGVSIVIITHNNVIAKRYCDYIIDLEKLKGKSPPETAFYGMPTNEYESGERQSPRPTTANLLGKGG